MNATAKNSMHHEPNPKFGHEIECAECFELFPGPMDANVGDTITCPGCKATLVLADIDGEYETDSASPRMTFRWEVKSTPMFCPACSRSHCGCAAYIPPAAEPHHGSEASPQQESTNPRSTSSPAPEVMAPAGAVRGMRMEWTRYRTFALSLHRGVVYADLECLLCAGTCEQEVDIYYGSRWNVDPPSGRMVHCSACDNGRRVLPSSGDGSEDFDATWTAMIDALPKYERQPAIEALNALEDAAVVAQAAAQ